MIFENYSLKKHNTFGLDIKARFFASPENKKNIIELLRMGEFLKTKPLILGSGSNILFTRDFDGLVIKPEIKDITLVKETDDSVFLRAGAGVVWDDFVAYCTDRGWGGVENLSGIPGTVGASPVQNIGAYGSEAKDCIEYVEYLDLDSLKKVTLSGKDCGFGYRDSVFKNSLKSQTLIMHVTFILSKHPTLNIGYADLSDFFKDRECKGVNDIREAVIEIRNKKLPDPAVIGNAGSFFKNPVVEITKAEQLKKLYPTLKTFPAGEGLSKLPAAWFIDQCGYKGKRSGNAGVHSNQPLVLLAYEGARAEEILNLATEIINTVRERFGIEISPEVNIF